MRNSFDRSTKAVDKRHISADLTEDKTMNTPDWKDLPLDERQKRGEAMRAVAPSAHINPGFPYVDKISITGSFTIAELRALLAAAEGRDLLDSSDVQ
jgi:hypothetical protein